MSVDSSNRVVNGLREMAIGHQSFSANMLNVMLAEEYNHMVLLCILMERKYENLMDRRHWIASYEQLHAEAITQLPPGTKIMEANVTSIMEKAKIEFEVIDAKIVALVQIPLVYKSHYEVLEIFAMPNITTGCMVKVDKNRLILNELQGAYAYIDDQDIVEKVTETEWLIKQKPMRIVMNDQEDCVAAAILRKNDGKNCATITLPANYNVWTEINANKRLFYSSNHEVGWYKCATSRDRILEATGMISVLPGCSIEAADVEILEAVNVVSKRDTFLIQERELIDVTKLQEMRSIDVSKLANIPHQNFTMTTVGDVMLTPGPQDQALLGSVGLFGTVWHWLLVAMTVNAISATIGVIIYCYRAKRQGRNPRAALEQEFQAYLRPRSNGPPVSPEPSQGSIVELRSVLVEPQPSTSRAAALRIRENGEYALVGEEGHDNPFATVNVRHKRVASDMRAYTNLNSP